MQNYLASLNLPNPKPFCLSIGRNPFIEKTSDYTSVYSMNRIPVKFHSIMGKHEIELHGVKVTAHTAESPAVVDEHIADLRCSSPEVVGIDIKKFKSCIPGCECNQQHLLVLCVSTHCVTIPLEYKTGYSLRASLLNFLKDPNICFIGLEKLPPQLQNFGRFEIGVRVDELAARVLNKPGLIKSSLADLAREVGVCYEAPSSGSITSDTKLEMRWPIVLSDEEAKFAVDAAFTHYQIGHKLLSSLTASKSNPVIE